MLQLSAILTLLQFVFQICSAHRGHGCAAERTLREAYYDISTDLAFSARYDGETELRGRWVRYTFTSLENFKGCGQQVFTLDLKSNPPNGPRRGVLGMVAVLPELQVGTSYLILGPTPGGSERPRYHECLVSVCCHSL